jgi:hypothetical protein
VKGCDERRWGWRKRTEDDEVDEDDNDDDDDDDDDYDDDDDDNGDEHDQDREVKAKLTTTHKYNACHSLTSSSFRMRSRTTFFSLAVRNVALGSRPSTTGARLGMLGYTKATLYSLKIHQSHVDERMGDER